MKQIDLMIIKGKFDKAKLEINKIMKETVDGDNL